MKRLDQILGLPVINRADGRAVGRVTGLRIAKDGRGVDGLLGVKNGLREQRLLVPLAQALLVGDVSVIVDGHGRRDNHQGLSPKVGQRVVSTSGARIGLLTNALVDERAGAVSALEVSRGALDDWLDGRIWVRHFRISDGEIIASPEENVGEGEIQ